MGVVHKLTKDVISFVIKQKIDNPTMGCRSLSEIVSKYYNIEVSKSSINTILKDAKLSSPLGRRPVEEGFEKKQSKFKIPHDKKLRSSSDSSKESFMADEQVSAKRILKQSSVEKKVVHFRTHSVQKAGNVATHERTFDKNVIYENMGYVFLQGALWDLSKQGIITSLIKKYTNTQVNRSFQGLDSLCLFMHSFAIKDISEAVLAYQKSGLGILNGLDNEDKTILMNLLENFKKDDSLFLKFCNEIGQIFSRVSCLKICLEDGSCFWVDSQFIKISAENVQKEILSNVTKGITNIYDYIINNVHSAVFLSAPEDTESLYNFIASFENIKPKGIKQIILFDENLQEISTLGVFFSKKRYFICGVWQWQKPFEILMSKCDFENIKNFYSEVFQKRFYFTEAKVDIVVDDFKTQLNSLQVIFLFEPTSKRPFLAILSNILKGKIPTEEILEAFLLRWPNVDNGPSVQFLKEPTQKRLLEETKTLLAIDNPNTFLDPNWQGVKFWLWVEFLYEGLLRYCHDMYFCVDKDKIVSTDMLNQIFRMPGQLLEKKNCLEVSLILPFERSFDVSILVRGILRFNESDIHDYEGRRVYLTLKNDK